MHVVTMSEPCQQDTRRVTSAEGQLPRTSSRTAICFVAFGLIACLMDVTYVVPCVLRMLTSSLALQKDLSVDLNMIYLYIYLNLYMHLSI